MWLRDSPRGSECIRIGLRAVERWRGRAGAMQLVSSHALHKNGAAPIDGLAEALQAALASPSNALTALVESAWAPVVLADTGGSVWAHAALDALLRHRFAGAYREAADPVAGWDVRAWHRPGDRWALGFGLPARLRACLDATARQAGIQWNAYLPACAWGLYHLQPHKALPRRSGWWLWPEQDRQLLFRMERGIVQGLNAAVGIDAHTAVSVEATTAIEALRAGAQSSAQARVVVASWQALPRLPAAAGRVSWRSITGPSFDAVAAPSVPEAVHERP